uniref:Putative secreted protein n=1 Tax=Ixodes ricinus TaxID=34613 RepID=A0A147BJJ6_IXORI
MHVRLAPLRKPLLLLRWWLWWWWCCCDRGEDVAAWLTATAGFWYSDTAGDDTAGDDAAALRYGEGEAVPLAVPGGHAVGSTRGGLPTGLRTGAGAGRPLWDTERSRGRVSSWLFVALWASGGATGGVLGDCGWARGGDTGVPRLPGTEPFSARLWLCWAGSGRDARSGTSLPAEAERDTRRPSAASTSAASAPFSLAFLAGVAPSGRSGERLWGRRDLWASWLSGGRPWCLACCSVRSASRCSLRLDFLDCGDRGGDMACATAGGTSFVWMVILLLLLSRVLMVILDRAGGLSAGGSDAFCRCSSCGQGDRTVSAAWALPKAAGVSAAIDASRVPGRRVSAAGTTGRVSAPAAPSGGCMSLGTSVAGGPAAFDSRLATLWATSSSTPAEDSSGTGRPGAVASFRGHCCCCCPAGFPSQCLSSTSAWPPAVSVGAGRFAGWEYTRKARRRGESLFQV